jgi:hypothetical protein
LHGLALHVLLGSDGRHCIFSFSTGRERNSQRVRLADGVVAGDYCFPDAAAAAVEVENSSTNSPVAVVAVDPLRVAREQQLLRCQEDFVVVESSLSNFAVAECSPLSS